MADKLYSHQGGDEARLFAASSDDARHFAQQFERLGLSSKQTSSGGLNAALKACREQGAPTTLLVDIDGADALIPQLEELRTLCGPACQLVVIGSQQDIDLYRRLLHFGALDYLVKPVPFDLLAATLARARHDSPPMPGALSGGRTVAITGASGGAGVSTIVAGLAQHFARQGRIPTAVVDFDQQYSDQLLLLGQQGDAGLDAALASDEIDASFLRRTMLAVEERLSLLGQLPSVAAPAPQPQRVLTLGAQLCQLYSQVIWDLPSGLPAGALDVLSHAHCRILVCQPNIKDARRARMLLERLGSERGGQQLLLVTNAPRTSRHALPQEQLQDFLGRRIDISLPHVGQALDESLLQGALRCDKAAPFATAISQLADLTRGAPLHPRPRMGHWLQRLGLLRRQHTTVS